MGFAAANRPIEEQLAHGEPVLVVHLGAAMRQLRTACNVAGPASGPP
jgi:hypothetical protein